MKNLPLLLLAVLIIAGFTAVNGTQVKPEMARCVDLNSRVVENRLCNGPAQAVAVAGSLNPLPQYKLYYGGFGNKQLGSYAWGGSDRPLSGHVYESSYAADPTPGSTTPAPGFYLGAAASGSR